MVSSRWLYLVHLHNAILDNDHQEIEKCVALVRKATIFSSYSSKEWQCAVEVCGIDYEKSSYCCSRYVSYHLNVIVKQHKDAKALLLFDNANFNIKQGRIIDALCELHEYDLLIQMIKDRRLNVFHRQMCYQTLLVKILTSEETLTDQVKQAALQWYKLASKSPAKHGLFCKGMYTHMHKTAELMLRRERQDVFQFLVEECELTRHCPYSPWAKRSSLLRKAIYFGNRSSVDVLLAHGYSFDSYRLDYAHYCAKYGYYETLDHLLGRGLKIKRLDYYFRLITKKEGECKLDLVNILKKHGYPVPLDILSPANTVSTKRFRGVY